jgi:hypothetical protein
MIAQKAYGWSITWDQYHTSNPITVQVKNRNVYAEVALTGTLNSWEQADDFHIWLSSIIGITQIVSDSGVEDFGPIDEHHYRQAVYRENVTSVTVQLAGETISANPGYGWARGRLFLNYWN